MFSAAHIPYRNTGSFSKLVLDYLDEHSALQPFYSFSPTIQGIKEAIEQKKKQNVNRQALVNVLIDQYKALTVENKVVQNINAILSADTFTICTAHQPNLFTGPLYFIYKILHAIKVADHLKQELPQYNFVPVYYMGCEDADLAELNHFTVEGKKYEWNTNQTGAVGRMTIDKQLTDLINELEGHIGGKKNGQRFIQLLHDCYTAGDQIQDATFKLVHALFSTYGLVVLISDEARLKQQMLPVFEDDLFEGTPSTIVEKTSGDLANTYQSQAHPRQINLFYLKENIRERIEKREERFYVLNSTISFSENELRTELSTYPERFSPNVILRGLFQETILPNIAFIGGGGELAYWLQLKDLFQHYNIVFPVLVLRNSFLIVEEKWVDAVKKSGLSYQQLFETELVILNSIIQREGKMPQLNGSVKELEEIYESLKNTAKSVDATLLKHIEALKVKSVQKLITLEKKMLRAERKKRSDIQVAIARIKDELFPKNSLQERVENLSGFYAKWGNGFIEDLHKHSLSLEQQFTVITASTES